MVADVACGSLGQAGPIANSLDFSKDKELDHLAVVGALKSLGADNYVTVTSRPPFPAKSILPERVSVFRGVPGRTRSYAVHGCLSEKSAL